MNKIKFLSLLIGCMAAFTFTACNDDDDNSDLTPAEKAQCFAAIGGNYTGQMIYYSENKANVKDVTDTVAIRWNIKSDSTMTIYSFPASLIAMHVTDDALKTALQSADPISIDASINFASLSPIAFFVNPVTPTLSLTYGDKTHKVQPVFYINNSYSFGQYSASEKTLQMQIVLAAIWVDGAQTAYLSGAPAYMFVAKR